MGHLKGQESVRNNGGADQCQTQPPRCSSSSAAPNPNSVQMGDLSARRAPPPKKNKKGKSHMAPRKLRVVVFKQAEPRSRRNGDHLSHESALKRRKEGIGLRARVER